MDCKAISLVIPTSQRHLLLQRCLNAILQQDITPDSFEVIIVSDGKDSLTAAIVREIRNKFPNRSFRYLHTERRSGPATARNIGWCAADGELIVFTDDDCVPDQNWLQRYWNRYITTQLEEVAFTGRTVVPLPENPKDFEKNLANLETCEFITANCACSKKALLKVDGFDEHFTMAWREDSDLQFKLIKANIPIIKLAEAIVLHPVRTAEWGVSLYDQKKAMFEALLYKKHPELYRQKIKKSPHWNYYLIIIFFIASLCFMIKENWLLSIVSTALWLICTGTFFFKRLKGTSKKSTHVMEMLVTSICIPFLSVYWTLYGSYRYKKLTL